MRKQEEPRSKESREGEKGHRAEAGHSIALSSHRSIRASTGLESIVFKRVTARGGGDGLNSSRRVSDADLGGGRGPGWAEKG